jgi:hypothetical protein
MTLQPSSFKEDDSTPACCFARDTSTRHPESGLSDFGIEKALP